MSLGRIAGIRVNIHWSALLIAFLSGIYLVRLVSPVAVLAGTTGFLLSILLHEFGHALTARRFEVRPSREMSGGVAVL